VWFTDEEAYAMAAYLKLDVNEFLRRHAHTVNGRWTLNERVGPAGYDCVFLQRDAKGKALYSIYGSRPMQCRTWPFWNDLLKSQKDWDRAAERCPGMNKGTFYPIEKIRVIRDGTPPK
jgi:Fe-S-cluster containining protein